MYLHAMDSENFFNCSSQQTKVVILFTSAKWNQFKKDIAKYNNFRILRRRVEIIQDSLSQGWEGLIIYSIYVTVCIANQWGPGVYPSPPPPPLPLFLPNCSTIQWRVSPRPCSEYIYYVGVSKMVNNLLSPSLLIWALYAAGISPSNYFLYLIINVIAATCYWYKVQIEL